MTGLSDITGLFSRWIDTVAGAIVAALSSLGKRKTVQVIEEDGGSFVIQTGRSTPSGLPFERTQIVDGRIVAAHAESVAAMLEGSRAELVRYALEVGLLRGGETPPGSSNR